MKKHLSIIITGIVILLTGLLFLFPPSAPTPIETQTHAETTHIRFADLPVIHSLPFYLALDKGYFEEAGLTVEVTEFESPNQLIDALMAEQIDMTTPSGAMGIAGIAAHQNPDHIEIYMGTGGDEERINDAFLVKHGSEIEGIEDLSGTSIGILPGIQWRTIAEHLLSQFNIPIEEVTLVELAPGLQATALESGQIDVLLAIQPMVSIVTANDIGYELLDAATVKGIDNPFYGGAGILRSEFAKENPTTTATYLEIMERAIDEVYANPEEARWHLREHTPLSDALIEVVPILRFTMSSQMTQDDIDAIQTFYDIFFEYEVVDERIFFEELMYL